MEQENQGVGVGGELKGMADRRTDGLDESLRGREMGIPRQIPRERGSPRQRDAEGHKRWGRAETDVREASGRAWQSVSAISALGGRGRVGSCRPEWATG